MSLQTVHKSGEPQSPFRDDILAGRVVMIVSPPRLSPRCQWSVVGLVISAADSRCRQVA